MLVLELIGVSIYTLLIALGAGFIGYLIGARELRRVIEERIIKAKHEPAAKPSSGAVKQITPQEIAAGKDEQAKRIKELLND